MASFNLYLFPKFVCIYFPDCKALIAKIFISFLGFRVSVYKGRIDVIFGILDFEIKIERIFLFCYLRTS